MAPGIYPDSKVHGANMGPPGSCRPQMGPMLAPWTLLSVYLFQGDPKFVNLYHAEFTSTWHVFIFYHFMRVGWLKHLKSLLVEDKDHCIPHIYDQWCPSDARSEGIYSIGFVFLNVLVSTGLIALLTLGHSYNHLSSISELTLKVMIEISWYLEPLY